LISRQLRKLAAEIALADGRIGQGRGCRPSRDPAPPRLGQRIGESTGPSAIRRSSDQPSGAYERHIYYVSHAAPLGEAFRRATRPAGRGAARRAPTASPTCPRSPKRGTHPPPIGGQVPGQ
jgi:hypothetical protein